MRNYQNYNIEKNNYKKMKNLKNLKIIAQFISFVCNTHFQI